MGNTYISAERVPVCPACDVCALCVYLHDAVSFMVLQYVSLSTLCN